MNDQVKRNWPAFIWVTFYLAVAKLIGDMTRSEISLWYNSLVKPPLNPPDIAFGIVWTILYILIAIAGWRLWQRKNLRAKYAISRFLRFKLCLTGRGAMFFSIII